MHTLSALFNERTWQGLELWQAVWLSGSCLTRGRAAGRLQDLQQIKDRENWYLPKFSADDAPDWNPGRFVRSRQLTLGLREVRQAQRCRSLIPMAGASGGAPGGSAADGPCIRRLRAVDAPTRPALRAQVVVEAEISRDKVPLRNAYKHVGQRASLRINSGVEHSLLGAPSAAAALVHGAWRSAPWPLVRSGARRGLHVVQSQGPPGKHVLLKLMPGVTVDTAMGKALLHKTTPAAF